MVRLLEYIRTAIFVVGVLVGIQLPGLVDQYAKAVESHLSESQASLQAFQGDADRFFEGSLPRLVEHYKASSDQVFIDGGESIEVILIRNQLLSTAQTLFYQHSYSPYVQLLFNPVKDIRVEVFAGYSYVIMLDSSAILIGLLAGVMAAIIFESLSGLLLFFIRMSSAKLRLDRG